MRPIEGRLAQKSLRSLNHGCALELTDASDVPNTPYICATAVASVSVSEGDLAARHGTTAALAKFTDFGLGYWRWIRVWPYFLNCGAQNAAKAL